MVDCLSDFQILGNIIYQREGMAESFEERQNSIYVFFRSYMFIFLTGQLDYTIIFLCNTLYGKYMSQYV